jgi:Asp-tRNA(Asn)/Glu-tRNA(Gln) amidotransferase A subunit family amidase
MMMEKLAEATAKVDVYVVAANPSVGGGPPATTTASEPPRPTTPQTPAQRHFAMANLACYPAINVPNGFLESGSPTNVTFYGRPFGEMEVIALAKAYQDAAGFHLKHPTALDT